MASAHLTSFLFWFVLIYVNVDSRPDPPPGEPHVWDGTGWLPIKEEFMPGHPRPYAPKDESYKDPDKTIFVGIAAYRDTRCAKTLYNMFTKAKYPDRLRIGLVWQNDVTDADCVEGYCKLMGHDPNPAGPPKKAPVAGLPPEPGAQADADMSRNCPHFHQIKVHRVTHKLAVGPTFGRHLQSNMIEDEEFCMQSDSHMDYVDHWDEKMVEQWGMTENEYAVITTYVNRLEDLNRNINGRYEVPHLCQMTFIKDGGLPRNERAKGAINLSRPKLTTIWAAGYAFSKCHAEKQTPYDPQLPGVFDGEEFTKAARLWTRGYDFYTPHRSYIVHDYNKPKDYNPLSWQRNQKDFNRAKQRIYTLLEMEGGDNSTEARAALGKYGLGDKRTLDQYIEFSGVDMRHRKTIGARCATLHWVPFEEDPRGPWGPVIREEEDWKRRLKSEEAKWSGKQLETVEEKSEVDSHNLRGSKASEKEDIAKTGSKPEPEASALDPVMALERKAEEMVNGFSLETVTIRIDGFTTVLAGAIFIGLNLLVGLVCICTSLWARGGTNDASEYGSSDESEDDLKVVNKSRKFVAKKKESRTGDGNGLSVKSKKVPAAGSRRPKKKVGMKSL